MDTYQPIYEAVRSKITGGNIGDAVREAVHDANIGWHMEMIKQEFVNAALELQRPSILFKPTLTKDGNAWIALFGDNLQEGVVGCGDTPGQAMRDFDNNWHKSAA